MLVSCLAYSSMLRMEGTCSSETSVDTQQTTRCYIPESSALRYLYLRRALSCRSMSSFESYRPNEDIDTAFVCGSGCMTLIETS
jgi:hypothetical protein